MTRDKLVSELHERARMFAEGQIDLTEQKDAIEFLVDTYCEGVQKKLSELEREIQNIQFLDTRIGQLQKELSEVQANLDNLVSGKVEMP